MRNKWLDNFRKIFPLDTTDFSEQRDDIEVHIQMLLEKEFKEGQELGARLANYINEGYEIIKSK